jgi:type IV pilus biogenesis protein CpaD/CtpE
MNIPRTALTTSVLGAMTLLLGACANEPRLTELNFGDSVRQMIRAQTYDPATLSSPSEQPVEDTDGQLLDNALGVYRNDVWKNGSSSGDAETGAGGSRP